MLDSFNHEGASKKDTERFWFDHLKAIDETGAAAVTYAKLNNLKVNALYKWRNKLKGRGCVVSNLPPNAQGPQRRLTSRRDIVDNPFVAMQVKPPVPVASTNCVVQCGVIRIEFGDVPSAAWIASLNEAVRRTS